VLFEDELHDNGTSQLAVRIRVTNNYFYVLQRVWIRVDGVIFRLRESRLLHRFSDSHALRLFSDREEGYEKVVKSCTPKQMREGILDDPNLVTDLLSLKCENTEKITFISGDTKGAEASSPNLQEQSEVAVKQAIQAQNAAAEEAFKRKFGNAKPNASALLQRQRQHETRYFDSGDAFSNKGKGGGDGGQAEEKLESLVVVQGQAEPSSSASSSEEAIRKDEIAKQNAAAEEAFKRKFGNAKPNAAALMQRQRQHETRYFDSGDAFSSKGPSKSAADASSESVASSESAAAAPEKAESDLSSSTGDSQSKDEIAQQNAAAEAAFKRKFGNAKPNAAALLQRQRQHETRYFDSGDAFSNKGKGGGDGGQAEEKLESLVVVQGQVSTPPSAEDDKKDEVIKQNAAAEEAFKRKFGNAKPNAAALLQRQRQHETRYFDSGDAFSKKEKGGAGASEEKLEHLAVVHGQRE
jgi:hypothetical protein